MRSNMIAVCGLIVACGVFGFSGSAEARDHGFVSIQLGGGHHHHDSGYWAYRTERVLVAPAHHDRVWVPRVTETRRDRHGHYYTVVIREGYYDTVYHPARYELRQVRYWVPVADCRPSLGLRTFFRF
ncbi:MAG: hypothetical protein M5U26_04425 [Planctomycetota bacterium]|nr:hypothetical protein [Planctomycetota bacterium]